jgi:propanol-preferring alcohol dehydrogenase
MRTSDTTTPVVWLGVMSETMAAWTFADPAPIHARPLRVGRQPVPEPGSAEVLLEVHACGICRTDLHLIEGDLPVHRRETVPGHQVVGTVVAAGSAASRFAVGDRLGIAWLRSTCGRCRWCRSGAENLCPSSAYTGWDADGGFAEYAAVPEAFAYRLPEHLDDVHVAPLLCAGIIGYRALRRTSLPPGGRLGIYGFGSSAHITAQIAAAEGAELFVMTRGEANRALARELGAAYVGAADARPPDLLDAAIVFAPAGELVPVALEALDRGGILALAGIHMSALPPLDYDRHLFQEREIRTVAANTRRDGEELLRLASRMQIQIRTHIYDFRDADRALSELSAGSRGGSLVVARE